MPPLPPPEWLGGEARADGGPAKTPNAQLTAFSPQHIVLACPAARLPRSERRGSRATLRCRGWHVISDVPEGVQPRRVSGCKAGPRGVTLRNRWHSRLELYPAVCEGGGTL